METEIKWLIALAMVIIVAIGLAGLADRYFDLQEAKIECAAMVP